MTNPHDTYARQALSRADVAADLVRHAFPSDVVAELRLDSLHLVESQLGDDSLRADIATDFLWELRTTAGDPVLVYVLLEHQSTVDRWMAFRMLRYRVRVWEAFRVREPRSPLPPVLPLVLYHGTRRWNAALDVAELCTSLDDATHLTAAYRVIDISRWTDEQVLDMAFGGFTQLAVLALANSRRGVSFESRLRAWADLIRSLIGYDEGFEAVVLMIKYWLRVNRVDNEPRAQEIARSFSPELEEVMTSFAEEKKAEGRLEGRLEGRAEGIAEERVAILRRLLTKKFGTITDALSTRIQTATPDDLERWLDRILTADSIDGVFRD